MRRFALALLPLILIASASHALPKRLPPVDQCSGDPSFAKFRARLQQAVVKRDRKAFLAMLSPHVLVNFGGASGPKAFAENWDFDPHSNDSIWAQLE